MIDHNKAKKAQEGLSEELDAKFEQELKQEGVTCILFDGRRDDTRYFSTEGKNVQVPIV